MKEQGAMSDHLFSFRISNSSGGSLTVYLEPWGECDILETGFSLEIEARGPQVDMLEITYGANCITVFGWPGSDVRILPRSEK